MKTLLNTQDHYNLSPMAYPWAFEAYKQARKNFWDPEQINMGRDLSSFQTLTPAEKEMFLDVFATLTTSDLAIQENLALRVYETITPPEVRLWLGHQLADESLHSYSYQHIIECLSLDDASVYRRYQERPYILKKFKLGNEYAKYIHSADPADKVLAIAFFYLCWEGLWFYHGFTPIFALGRKGKMPGTCEQLQYIAKDEVTHFTFGIKLVNALIDETGLRGDPELRDQLRWMFEKMENAEWEYADKGIGAVTGYSALTHIEHTRYLIDVRLQQIGLSKMYSSKEPPIPWLAEMIETRKEKNFFETHVTEYQTGNNLVFELNSMEDIGDWQNAEQQ